MLPKEDVFHLLGYAPRTEEVKAFHASSARFRIISAPARTSKSYSAAYDAIYHAIPLYEELNGTWYPCNPVNAQDIRVWIVGPDYKTIKEWDYVWRELAVLKKLKCLLPYSIVARSNSPQHGSMRLVLEWGVSTLGEPVRTVIEAKSATNMESLQGEQVWCAVLSEAAELPEVVWTRYLSTRCHYVIAPTTPKLRAEWLRGMIDAGEQDASLSIASFRYNGHANPHYDWDLFEIERKKAASRTASGVADDDPWFAEQFLGLWTGADERLLPFRAEAWGDRKAHVVRELPAWFDAANTFVSIDYGYADACVALMWALGPSGRMCIVGEVHDKELTSYEFVAAVERKCAALGISPSYYTGDPKQPQVNRIMQDRGLPLWPVDVKAQSDRAAGGQALVDALSDDPATSEPRLTVLGDVGNGWGVPALIREWKLLRRRTVATAKEWSQATVVGADHTFDAARYGIMTRPAYAQRTVENDIRRYIREKKAVARVRAQSTYRSYVGASSAGMRPA